MANGQFLIERGHSDPYREGQFLNKRPKTNWMYKTLQQASCRSISCSITMSIAINSQFNRLDVSSSMPRSNLIHSIATTLSLFDTSINSKCSCFISNDAHCALMQQYSSSVCSISHSLSIDVLKEQLFFCLNTQRLWTRVLPPSRRRVTAVQGGPQWSWPFDAIPCYDTSATTNGGIWKYFTRSLMSNRFEHELELLHSFYQPIQSIDDDEHRRCNGVEIKRDIDDESSCRRTSSLSICTYPDPSDFCRDELALSI